MKLTWRKQVLRLGEVRAHLRLPLYQNGYALIASSLATSGFGILYWVLAAHLYSPEILGLNSALLSALAFLSAVTQLNLGSVLIRFLPAAGPAAPRLIVAAYAAALCAAVLAGLTFAIGTDLWFPVLSFLHTNLWLLGGFALATAALALFNMQDSVLAGLKQALWVPFENVIFAIAKILLLVLLASRAQQYGIFASWTIPAGCAVVVVSVFLFRKFIPMHLRTGPATGQSVDRKFILRFAGINYLSAIFFQAATNLLPLLVAAQAGVTANAYFYLPWTITLALQMIAYNMSISFTVEAVRDPALLASLFRRALIHSTKIYIPIVVLLFVGAPWILGAFGGDYALQGTDLLRLLALSTLPYSVVALSFGLARVQNRVERVALFQAVSCVLALALSYVLLPIIGLTGIGVAWLTNQSVVALLLWLTEVRPFLHKTRTESAVLASNNDSRNQQVVRLGKDNG